MSSPLTTANDRPKAGGKRPRSIRTIVSAGVAALVILAGVAVLFANGLLFIPTGSLSPQLASVSLYVARGGLDVSALRASDGTTLWSYAGGGWYTAASDGLVFTSSTDEAHVFALRGSDGTRVWTASTVAGDVLAAGGGLVVVGLSDGQDPSRVSVANATDGSLRWDYQLDGINRPNATIAGDTVYLYGAGSSGPSPSSDVLYALRAEDGTLLWKATTRPSSAPAPAVGDGAVYVADNDGYVDALNASDGTQVWRAKIGTHGSGARSSLATGPGAVYASSFDGDIVALDASTGATLWRHRVNPASAPTAAGGVVYVNTVKGELVALSAKTGAQLWSYEVHGVLATFGTPRPLIIGGGVFEGVSGQCSLVCREAYVYGVRASDGAPAWRDLTPHIQTALVVA